MELMLSHPTRVRGLKPIAKTHVLCYLESHPTRVRGLKLAQLSRQLTARRRTPHGCVDDNADMEMYKGDSKFRITRITAFQSVCPICSVQIQIDYGKPDHKELLFGRCRESPLAHVYSFDRDTLKGFFLGHEGYLK